MNGQHSFVLYKFEPFIRCSMSKYDTVYFVGDNEAINRVQVDSSETKNRDALSGLLAALLRRYLIQYLLPQIEDQMLR